VVCWCLLLVPSATVLLRVAEAFLAAAFFGCHFSKKFFSWFAIVSFRFLNCRVEQSDRLPALRSFSEGFSLALVGTSECTIAICSYIDVDVRSM